MVENSRNYVRNVVYQGRRLLHTHLSRMELQKDEQYINGKSEEHAQWCRVGTGIIGRRSGHYILPSKSITLVNVGCHDSTQCYEENLSMARGKPQQTEMNAKINSNIRYAI
jgi:hypothetical protein